MLFYLNDILNVINNIINNNDINNIVQLCHEPYGLLVISWIENLCFHGCCSFPDLKKRIINFSSTKVKFQKS